MNCITYTYCGRGMFRLIIAGAFLAVTFPASGQDPGGCSPVELRYVANEGVLIKSADATILIDGIHRHYRDAYAYLPDDLHGDLVAGNDPFGKIDIALVSHVHGDHFSAEAAAAFLEANDQARMYSSPQVIDSLQVRDVEPDSYVEVTYDDASVVDFPDLDASISFFPVPHSSQRNAWVQNLGHLISVGGVNILHVGDADINEGNFEPYGLSSKDIDVALLPHWYLSDDGGKRLVERHLRGKHIVAVHISPNAVPAIRKAVTSQFPEAILFTEMLESHLTINNCHN